MDSQGVCGCKTTGKLWLRPRASPLGPALENRPGLNQESEQDTAAQHPSPAYPQLSAAETHLPFSHGEHQSFGCWAIEIDVLGQCLPLRKSCPLGADSSAMMRPRGCMSFSTLSFELMEVLSFCVLIESKSWICWSCTKDQIHCL